MNVKPGDRVRLVSMGPDPDPIPVGTEGVVDGATCFERGPRGAAKEWQIGVRWDNGRSLSVICPPDIVEIIAEPFPI